MGARILHFGRVEFDPQHGRLTVAGSPVAIDRYALAILEALASNPGTEVGKDHLLEAAWPGRLVLENSLAKAVGRLRTALGADGQAIKTVHGYGYKLEAEVTSTEADTPERAKPEPKIRLFRRPAIFASALLAGILGLGGIALYAQGEREKPVNKSEAHDAIGRILWVDDHPKNNNVEKRYLEQHRIAVYQVASTDEALMLMQMYEYSAVISDMGRNDDPLAGIRLLEEMRESGHDLPFFLYTVHSSEAQKQILYDTGGQGVAEDRGELYRAVLPIFEITPPVREEISS